MCTGAREKERDGNSGRSSRSDRGVECVGMDNGMELGEESAGNSAGCGLRFVAIWELVQGYLLRLSGLLTIVVGALGQEGVVAVLQLDTNTLRSHV